MIYGGGWWLVVGKRLTDTTSINPLTHLHTHIRFTQVCGPKTQNTNNHLKNLRSLVTNYKRSRQYLLSGCLANLPPSLPEGGEQRGEENKEEEEQIREREEEGVVHQLTLTPTLFWYDNTHIVETKHYRDFIFDETSKMVARGGFVEDKLSPVIRQCVQQLGLREGHERFGCYLLDDHSGLFFTGHLDGGGYMGKEEREEKMKLKK